MGARGRLRAAMVIGLAAAGCGGSSTSNPDGGPALDPATFAAGYCALFAPCCTDVGVAQGTMCKSLIANQSGLVGKVAALGQTCLDELKAKFDGFGYCNYALSSVPSCDSVLGQVPIASGTLPPGGDCSADLFSCAPGTRGDVNCTFADLNANPPVLRCQELISGGTNGQGPCIGTVEPNGVIVGNGDQFIASGYTCAIADGVYCDSTMSKCVPVLQPGQPCSDVDFEACPTNWCVNSICTARLALGAACSTLDLCVDGAYCDPTGVCAASKPAGAACAGYTSECLIGDCSNGICKPPWDASALGYLCQ